MAKSVPRHVAIIMDGNGRWARQRKLPRLAGHKRGAERVVEIVRAAVDTDVSVLTLYAFSSENWSRPQSEINGLMRLLGVFLDRQLPEMMKNKVRFRTIGRKDRLSSSLQKKITRVTRLTRDHQSLTLVLAIDYGSRQEILEGIRRFTRDVQEGRASTRSLNEKTFGSYLYTADLPDPDLLIRTSGELRISNFLLWQLSYAELYFPSVHWPDFSRERFAEALQEYSRRSRRFGGI